MRQFKFRVWDIKDGMFLKEYSDYPCLFYSIQKGSSEEFAIKMRDTRSFDMIVNNTRYIIQQYTGLLDKNGKEIYEGDILIAPEETYDWGEGPVTTGGRPSLVRWVHGRYIWEYDILDNILAESLDIIGNIRENPELLNMLTFNITYELTKTES